MFLVLVYEVWLLKIRFFDEVRFQLLTRTDALWLQIERNKYNVCGILPNSIAMSNCFVLWKSLSGIWTDVINNVYWAIEDGCLTKFWNENWICLVGPLRSYFRGLIDQMTLYVFVMLCMGMVTRIGFS